MVDQLGPERLASMANRLGVTAELDPVYSLVLGAEGVSVLDMASAYSTFSRHGVRIDPYIIERIEDSDGNVVFDAAVDVPRQQVIAPDVADTVTSVLTGVISRGTGKAASFGSPAAGKTGTTDNAEDAWFAGYTCDLTAVVWMGYEVPREMTTSSGGQMSGGATPARMWRSFMSRATSDDDDCDFAEVDYGDKVLNSEYSPSRSSKRSSQGSSGSSSGSTTSTSVPSGGSSTSVPRSTTTVPRSTTTAPRPTTPPTSSPPTTATSGGG
jgi:penicillin-binding protein 1A